jgi:hypothetical protein
MQSLPCFFSHLLAWKPNLEKNYIYSNKLFPNFYSSWASGKWVNVKTEHVDNITFVFCFFFWFSSFPSLYRIFFSDYNIDISCYHSFFFTFKYHTVLTNYQPHFRNNGRQPWTSYGKKTFFLTILHFTYLNIMRNTYILLYKRKSF